jgi:hypothetical protein
MKIENVTRFRDGGTFLIETNNGKYWIPGRLHEDHLKVFKGDNFFDGSAELVTDVMELHILISMLTLDSNFYHSIKQVLPK